MKQFLNYIPVVIGIIVVSGAILMTGGFAVGSFKEDSGELYADTQPPTTTVVTTTPSTKAAVLNLDGPETSRSIKTIPPLTSPTETSETSSTSSSSTSSTTTTRKKPLEDRGPMGVYTSIRVFLDIQRIVFYKTDSETGLEYPVTTVYCSTGKSSTPTRPTGEAKPYKLTGRKLTQAKFSNPSKYAGACTVRYAVEIRNPLWLHSEPYIYQGAGKTVNKATCDMAGYRALGRPVSSGCIRMSLRDAKFLYNVARPGMKCYILSSSKGYTIPATRPIPPANPGARNWDPTDPEWSGYAGQVTVEEGTAPTTTAAPTTETTTAATTTTTTTTTTTEKSEEPTPEPIEPPEPGEETPQD